MSEPTPNRLHEQVLACLRGDWKSLVVVPAEPYTSAMVLGDALVEASGLVSSTPTKLIKAENQPAMSLSLLIVEMVDHVRSGGRVVVVVDSVIGKQSAIPFTMAADAALLCVHLGVTSVENARRTVELVGKERFVGAVTVDQRAKA
jgi:hypothetical protein